MRRQFGILLVAVLVAGCAASPSASPPPPSAPTANAPASTHPTAAPAVAPTAALTEAAATPRLAASISPQPPAWRRAQPTTGLEDSQGLGVAGWFKDRWVVFGFAKDEPAIWWSKDGAAWHRADVGPAELSTHPVTVTAFATNGDVAVAVGSWNEVTVGGSIDRPLARTAPAATTVTYAVGSEGPRVITAATCEGLASADAAVLTSTDGATWTRVPDSPALRGQPMLGVTARDGGFVAAGGADGSGRSATWTSPDGRHWTRGSDAAALRAGWIGDVAALGTTVIAAGGTACGNEYGVPRAWRSTDGRTWSLAPALVACKCSGSAMHVAVSGNQAVISGRAGTQAGAEPVAVTWTSADGSHWILHPQVGQADPAWIGGIAATPDGFLAAGAGVRASHDGVDWTEVVPRDVPFRGIAVGPDGALAVGDQVWIGPPAVAPR
jgi:hypothetical protein